MHQQFGIPRALRFLSALILGAAFCVLLTAPAWAATIVVDNDPLLDCSDTDPAKPYCTIQAAIDAAAPGDTINVYPGTYNETASGRSIIGGGIYQFGLFIGKNNLNIQGVDAGGELIDSVPTAGMTMPVVITHATNNFGPSGVWVEGDNVTISGLRFLPNIRDDQPTATQNNKTFEITGNAFTLQYSEIRIADVNGTESTEGSVYFNGSRYDGATSHIQSYTIDSNRFALGSTIDITDGAGDSGDLANRKIINNVWAELPPSPRALISFRGTGGTEWYLRPVGGAVIEDNTFGIAPQYIRATGTYHEAQFDWVTYWADNDFPKAVVVGTGANPLANLRAYEYDAMLGATSYHFTNVRRIGGVIQPEIVHAAAGDTVLIKAGLYQENLTIDKHVNLVGSGSGDNPASNTVIRRPTPLTELPVVTLTGSGASANNPLLLAHLRIEPELTYGIAVPGETGGTAYTVRNIRFDDIQIVGAEANSGFYQETEQCLHVGKIASIEYLDIQNSAFNRCDYGWYFFKDLPTTSFARHITVRNTTFVDNSYKGVYVEKLSDALFENVVVSNNGHVSFYNQAWNAGIDINLKAGVYANLTFRNLIVASNGNGYQHGAGLMLKARDDGGTYGAHPATLTNVLVEGGLFTGNERGIRVGEPDKDNLGPTDVQIHGASLFGNVATYVDTSTPPAPPSAVGDLINYSQATVNATGNWWGVAGGPTVIDPEVVGMASASPGVINQVNGAVNYTPFLTEPPATTLAVPNATYEIPNATITINVPVQFNPDGKQLSALAFSLDYDQTCLSILDSNNDGTPDAGAVTFPSSLSGFTKVAGLDLSDADGELDIAIFDEVEPQDLLTQGDLVTVQFTIKNTCDRSQDRTEQIHFSSAPLPSFGTTGGASTAGTWLPGTLTLDFNQQPPDTAFTLSPNSVYEGMPVGEVVGTLSVDDDDAWETFTYAFADGTHDALFTISGNQVLVNGTFNYDTAPTLTIRVKATGTGGTEITRDLTIDVADYSTLALPAVGEYLYGVHGGTVAVPVKFTKRSNAVVAAKFTVTYESACLSLTGVSGLPTGWSNTGIGATVNMSGLSALDNGTVAVLNFNVTGACPAYPSPLTVGAPELRDTAGRVSARATNGVVYVIENDVHGDCNSDSTVNAGDFSAVVLEHFDDDTGRHTSGHWLEAPRPAFAGSPLGCDANVDQKIDISDLSCTVNVVFNDIACTTSFGLTGASMAATATLVQGQAVASDGALEVPVALESNGNALAAFAFTLRYDPAQYTLDLSDADQDGIPDAVAFNMPATIVRWAISNAGEGKLQLAGAGLQLPLPTLADGTLVTVRLTPTGGADGAGIRVDDASLGSTAGFSVSVVVVGPGGSLDRRIFLPAISQ